MKPVTSEERKELGWVHKDAVFLWAYWSSLGTPALGQWIQRDH